jgi:hypothetical protein
MFVVGGRNSKVSSVGVGKRIYMKEVVGVKGVAEWWIARPL